MRHLLLVATLLFAAACGGDSTDPTPAVAGSWTGTVTGTAASGQLALTLTESKGTVTGNGTLTTATDAVALTANGTYTPPTASLTLTADGFQPMNLTGNVAAKTWTGTLNGSGFVNSAITLNR